MDLKKEFSIDEKAELEGTWIDVDDGASILVARSFNENFAKAFRALPPGIRRRIDKGTVSRDKDTEIFSDLMANTILLNWKGLSDGGKTIVYSVKVAKEILIKYKEFRTFVWEMANEAQNFRDEAVEEDVKN